MHEFGQQPIKQVLKTISGLCKVFICRLKLDKAEEGFTYIIEALNKIHGAGPDTDLLSVVKFQHELSNMHLQQVDTKNQKTYDARDRPG